MRRSCCYARDILEMLQADLVMLFFFNLLLDMLCFFLVQIFSFFCEQNGERPSGCGFVFIAYYVVRSTRYILLLPCLMEYYVVSVLFLIGRPGSSEVPRIPLTRWDVSSTPANRIFPTKN